MTIIESSEELKKAWNELVGVFYEAWHLDKLIGMVNRICSMVVRGADDEHD